MRKAVSKFELPENHIFFDTCCFDPKLLAYLTSYVKMSENKRSSFLKISPHELIDNTVWPLEGVKFQKWFFRTYFT